MKTTIDISDAVMERCRKVIGQQRVTFRSLVEEGLDRVLDERLSRKPFKLKKVPMRGGGFQPGFDEASWDRIRDAAYNGRGA
jgi:hypothetical protein